MARFPGEMKCIDWLILQKKDALLHPRALAGKPEHQPRNLEHQPRRSEQPLRKVEQQLGKLEQQLGNLREQLR
ncbi:MAG TPA: hypothetical protein VN493_02985 [Thermoanaerobaculia bacterium]|nr:hypothetical protein [Thermoanaerobaculia bacterium]